MSVAVGQRVLSRFCGSRIKELARRTVIVRSQCTQPEKELSGTQSSSTSPIPQPDGICAAVLKKFSEPLSIENVDPLRPLQSNEVLVDVNYCAVNASDALLSKNMYIFEPNLPIVLGYEVVGKLIEIGKDAESNGYKVGDRVVVLNKDLYGGLAEKCVAEIGDVWRIPSNMKSLDAVSLFENYMTALIALERKVSIQEDDMMLINVGVSGVGLAAVDLATNVFRAKVIGLCASEDEAALMRERGVFASLRYKSKKFLQQISVVAAERNIKGIFDDASGEYFKKILNCFTNIYRDDATLKDKLRDDNFAVVVHHLSREGRVVVAGPAYVGAEGGSEVQESTVSISGVNLREYRKQQPKIYRQAGDDVLQFYEENLITPSCALIVGLHKVNDALQFVLNRKSAGKVVIDVRNKEADLQEIK